jgi:hypothetical protein
MTMAKQLVAKKSVQLVPARKSLPMPAGSLPRGCALRIAPAHTLSIWGIHPPLNDAGVILP